MIEESPVPTLDRRHLVAGQPAGRQTEDTLDAGAAEASASTLSHIPGARPDLPLGALARAFAVSPFYGLLMPDPRKRPAQLRWWMGALGAYACAHGCVDVLPAGRGAAYWLGPDEPFMRTAAALAQGLWQAPWRLGPSGLRRLLAVSRRWDELHAAEPRPHYYLAVIGVDPGLGDPRVGGAGWRRGWGSRLIARGLARADARGLPCYLETTNPVNLGFYRRHGFEVVAADPTGATTLGLPFWTMRRGE